MTDHYSRIFLLSHMRAYTSLAGHILGSHPAINGYFELHLSYEEPASLGRQLAEYRKVEPLKEPSRYLFDKLLHNQYRLLPERLGAVETKILVALREPEATLRSIVDLFSNKPRKSAYASPEQAALYYIERLAWLDAFCQTTERDYLYFDSEAFVNAPRRLLPALSQWLELKAPLSERYQRFSQTGQARKGDSSPHIHAGKIDRIRPGHADIRIPPALLQAAQAVYRACRLRIIDGAQQAVTL